MRSERRSALAIGVAVFLSGATLLGLEITASRVLAPTFGSSLFVWGSLIGVVLAGLSIGYWAGGALADHWPSPYLLVSALALGAGLVIAIPLVDEHVLDWIVTWDPGPRLDPLLASIALFGPASVVLASATPIAVRLAARSLERLGRTAGRLFSISTAGSIAGTFLTAFWLVPEFGTDQVIAVGAVTLLVAATVVAASQKVSVPVIVGLAAATAAAVALTISLAPEVGGRLEGTAAQNWSPLHRQREARKPGKLDPESIESLASGFTVLEAKDTRYHRMFVVESDESRFLRFDSSFQSGMWLDDPYRTRFAYTDYLDLGIAYNPQAERILFLGLGGGSAPKRVWRDFPDAELQVVELDPEVVSAARRWFQLPDDTRLKVDVEDGRRWLQRNDGVWDVIVLDAFFSDSIPFHLATREFIELVRARLAPGGVVVANIIGAITGEDSKLLRSMAKTYRSVLPTVELHPVYEGEDDRHPEWVRNVILVAGDGAPLDMVQLHDRWDAVTEDAPQAPDLGAAIEDRWQEPLESTDVPVLTDDYAPTDSLLLG